MNIEQILLAAPRGFCAGVAYAIEVVDLALKVHGPPLYVRHAIVHNEHVVRSFEKQGVVFVEDVNDIPENSVVVFSAHGVSPAVRNAAAAKNLKIIDATCPLVTKVHREVVRYANQNYNMLYVGHRGHVEAEGTMGEAPGKMFLVDGVAEAESIDVPDGKLAVVTQTTLSVDEVEQIMTVLQRRYPHLEKPPKEDICYATTNRQIAVKALSEKCDVVLVVGIKSSSNSNRLREVAESFGIPAHLVMEPADLNSDWFYQKRCVGITSGASTPESLVENIIGYLLEKCPSATVETLKTVHEDVTFIPPRDLIALAQAKN